MEKIYTVYELYDMYGNIVDVGYTSRSIGRRLYEHTKVKPGNSGHGRHYGKELTIHAVRTFVYREDALDFEGQLKLEYGFEWTEKTSLSKRGKAGGAISGKLKRIITYDRAEELRAIYQNSNLSQRELAKLLNMSRSTLGHILNRTRYDKP